MKILITNDDGVHAQGIIQLAKHVREFAEVFIVAPSVEQSGVSQAITFLRPLFPVRLGGSKDSQDDHLPGFSVNGTPVDCVKLALGELCPWKPDLVLSGINGGLNAGINVGHSGTVGAALAASTFDVLAMSISLESGPQMDFHRAAEIVCPLIQRYSAAAGEKNFPPGTVFNINVPQAALIGDAEVALVPVETNPMAFHFAKGRDPKQRAYFWSTNAPAPQPSEFETDTQALREGKITVSALNYNLNSPAALDQLVELKSKAVKS